MLTQLGLKHVCIAFIFCPAIPLLLPGAAVIMYFSYWVDRYNLLRVFKPPPRTTDRTVTMSVLYILPIAVFGHILFAIFFYSKQAQQDVPLIYYAALTFLALLIMVRAPSRIPPPPTRRTHTPPHPNRTPPSCSDVRQRSRPPQPSTPAFHPSFPRQAPRNAPSSRPHETTAVPSAAASPRAEQSSSPEH